LNLQNDPVPIREEASGALRVGETRVLLELVIHAFEDGATPETIVQRYETLRLPDVYAVIAYYLRHPGEIDEYLRRRERQAAEVRQRIDDAQHRPPSPSPCQGRRSDGGRCPPYEEPWRSRETAPAT
jgi:uncharacterized protein (DUF433 family)